MSIFRKKVDFFELLGKQCAAMVGGMRALYDYCTTCDEKFGDDASPSPLSVFVFILIAHRTIANGKQNRATFLPARTCYGIFLYRFQVFGKLQPFAGTDAFGC